MTKTKLSIIITAHDEGLMAHHTMLSVFRALEDFKERYEIIIHIDSGDRATKDYFARYKGEADIKFYENDFHDAGEARNFAVKQASGRYVSILDADDLISRNYFMETIKVLDEADDDIIVHPNYCLAFKDVGIEYVLQTLGESIDPETDAILQFGRHRWISAVSGPRKIFLKIPYIKTENGFGHEDYTLNTALTAAGVLHKVAKNTIYFYRRKDMSRLQQNNNNLVAQPYSELYDFQKWQKFRIEDPEIATTKSRKQQLKDRYVRLRRNKVLNLIIRPAAELAKKVTGKKLIEEPKPFSVPAEVLSEWRKIAKIENQIFPTEEVLEHTTEYTTEFITELSRAYYKISQQVQDKPDYIFMTPWIVPGGAEKVLLNYLEALKELHPDWHIAVITMLDTENIWKDKLPENAFLIEYGQAARNLSLEDRDTLLTQMLIQLQCPKVHIINATETLGWMLSHQTLVKHNFKVTVSLFCHGLIVNTNGEGIWDIADPFVTRVYRLIDKFYTDNTAVIDYLVQKEGYDRDKFAVHYQPTPMATAAKKKPREKSDRPLKVLWAGRISLQKNPKLLVRIARKVDPNKIRIDAYGRIDKQEQDGFEFPEDVPALQYHGPFENFAELKPTDYDVFLHTSIIDGMPNVVLEAASYGLITLAGNNGGVGDFVKTGRTGFLVGETEDENQYVKILNKIQQDSERLSPMIEEAQKLLKTQYGWENFLKSVEKAFK